MPASCGVGGGGGARSAAGLSQSSAGGVPRGGGGRGGDGGGDGGGRRVEVPVAVLLVLVLVVDAPEGGRAHLPTAHGGGGGVPHAAAVRARGGSPVVREVGQLRGARLGKLLNVVDHTAPDKAYGIF